MAAERLSMRQTRQILRQKWSLGRTHREVAESLGISATRLRRATLASPALDRIGGGRGAAARLREHSSAEAVERDRLPQA
jgi:hypothetical protein